MSNAASRGPTATIADWLAQPEDGRAELIDGELIEKASPTFEHGRAQLQTGGSLSGAFDRKTGGSGGPGAPLKERPVTIRPDWLCEVVSESNRTADTVTKLRRYHQAGVTHYWIIDQMDRTLTVHRHTPEGYLVALRAEAGERVRAEPFGAIELQVAVLLGEDPDDDA